MTEKDNEIMEDDELIVVMTDEEGNEYYYREELIIPVGDQRFALLVEIQEEDCEEGCGDGCDCGCGGDTYYDRLSQIWEDRKSIIKELLDLGYKVEGEDYGDIEPEG